MIPHAQFMAGDLARFENSPQEWRVRKQWRDGDEWRVEVVRWESGRATTSPAQGGIKYITSVLRAGDTQWQKVTLLGSGEVEFVTEDLA